MKTTVVYHSADYDGIFCREIARKFIPDAEFIGWNFGDAIIPVPEGQVYIMDLSPECIFVLGAEPDFNVWTGLRDRIVWIDHHKTSIAKYPDSIPGYRIDGVAACRLAWQWFTIVDGNTQVRTPKPDGMSRAGVLPMIQHFKNREVEEPLAVRLAGEYDVWDKRDPDAETLQYGLRCTKLTPELWNQLLGGDGANSLLEDGLVAQRYAQNIDADIVQYRSYLLEWEGLRFLTMNALRCNSLSFAAKDVLATGHDALLAYYFNGKQWTVSMYHAAHRKDLDLSVIAVKHGGGGHKGACGFTCKELPFALT